MTTFEEQHHRPPNRYNPHAWIIGVPEIGDGTWIGAFTVIDGSGGLRIGSKCDISAGAQIYTHSTVQRCLSNGASDVERASTTLGDRVHVGAGAIILMGASIGSDSVIGAGCVVPQFTDIPPGSVVVGVPARVVGSTDDLVDAPDLPADDEV
jgi:acetyltransferase-like isoleucine patch superfamily enzyme